LALLPAATIALAGGNFVSREAIEIVLGNRAAHLQSAALDLGMESYLNFKVRPCGKKDGISQI
jgi:hypothetical protein